MKKIVFLVACVGAWLTTFSSASYFINMGSHLLVHEMSEATWSLVIGWLMFEAAMFNFKIVRVMACNLIIKKIEKDLLNTEKTLQRLLNRIKDRYK